ncbi:MAG: molecular chaperone HtpG [Lentisphaeria bacterium]|nr:molecular chaperone HtpG [Lentisphaeria bacterium]
MAKKQFKTEVQQLLDLVIHSLYSNKDIFLRELVANAADAIDKARFEGLTNPQHNREWAIRIEPDKDNKTLKIIDNGIGMTEDEVIENIGTIAKSGTKAFLKQLEENKNVDAPELIGQFGVGFYSAFMVADKVVIETKKSASDAPAVRWESTGSGSYDIRESAKTEPGTEITVFLKEAEGLYLEDWKISEIIHRYSDFIAYPIIVPHVTVNDDKTETVEDKVLNSQKAIWLRKPSEITEEEYQSFFAHVSHGQGKYAKAIHISAEGTSEFKALLFIPEVMPFNMFMPDFQKKGLQLYVKRVFITDECKELIPDYLRFVKGVVDSGDLPLNVSREILQDNAIIGRIQKAITGKVLGELKKMQESEPEAYKKFFKEFGKVLKEGIHTDYTNQEKIKALALYETMNTPAGDTVSLAEYIKAMPENQKDIYYITGDSRAHIESNPALELLKSKGFDVLFMTDPIDEWVMQSMFQYEKKSFKNVVKGEFELEGEEKDAAEKLIADAKEKFKILTEKLQKKFDSSVKEVRFTSRLVESPACLVGDEHSISPQMERLFKAMNQEMPSTKRILELNAKHPLIEKLQSMAADNAESAELDMYAQLLYDQALLAEGSPIEDSLAFSKNLAKVMLKSLD